MHNKRCLYQINKFTSYTTFDINGDVRYILEARKRALAKKKKLRSLGKRAQSADSEDEMEVDGESDIYFNPINISSSSSVTYKRYVRDL